MVFFWGGGSGTQKCSIVLSQEGKGGRGFDPVGSRGKSDIKYPWHWSVGETGPTNNTAETQKGGKPRRTGVAHGLRDNHWTERNTLKAPPTLMTFFSPKQLKFGSGGGSWKGKGIGDRQFIEDLVPCLWYFRETRRNHQKAEALGSMSSLVNISRVIKKNGGQHHSWFTIWKMGKGTGINWLFSSAL